MFKTTITTLFLLLSILLFPVPAFAYDGLIDKQDMDLVSACNNQYKKEGYNSLYSYTSDHTNPWSWKCRRKDNEKIVGGIDLHKYCQNKSWDNLSYFLIGETAYDFVCAKACHNVVSVQIKTRSEIRITIINKMIYNTPIQITEYEHVLSNGEVRTMQNQISINECIT